MWFSLSDKRETFTMIAPWIIRLDLGRIMSWVRSQVVFNRVSCAGKNADANSLNSADFLPTVLT